MPPAVGATYCRPGGSFSGRPTVSQNRVPEDGSLRRSGIASGTPPSEADRAATMPGREYSMVRWMPIGAGSPARTARVKCYAIFRSAPPWPVVVS